MPDDYFHGVLESRIHERLGYLEAVLRALAEGDSPLTAAQWLENYTTDYAGPLAAERARKQART